MTDPRIEAIKKRYHMYKETFSTPTGIEVLKDLQKECYINRSTITNPSNPDPYITVFREGQRAVVLKIQNLMSKDQLDEIEKRETELNKESN